MQNKSKFIIFVIFISLIFLNTSFLISPLNVQKKSLSNKDVSLNIADDYGTIQWGWISGTNFTNVNGVYGTKGEPNLVAYPGSRWGSISCTDLDGNLWLFGGDGYTLLGDYGYLNDLWRYNITSNAWTWMSGRNTANVYGVYGTKGAPNAANYPGSRIYSAFWYDMDGNLWLCGGHGYAASSLGYLNDLWRYNITSEMWTWISGSNTANVYGVYGTKGVPDTVNYPGSRYCSSYWTDEDGNLWLCGGEGNAASNGGFLNDLWRYNITSEMWTWMSGNNTAGLYGVYGTKGVTDIATYPGSRMGSGFWIDLDDNLYLCGGYGYAASGGEGRLNDLWRYNITSKTWMWMSGNNSIDVNGEYGMKGVPNANIYPGSRSSTVSWTDSEGNLWLFGGVGYAASGGSGRLNDLWRYNITSKIWMWMSGNNSIDVNGVYGTKGVPNANIYPGSRSSTVSWTDSEGNLWLFGGYGYAASENDGYLNDLWKYNIASKTWTWMSGTNSINVNGVYGTKGGPNITGYPGSRMDSASWTDLDGNLWLFGGYGYAALENDGYLNDLWKYNITSEMWTWMSGNNTYSVYGVYGTKGVPNISDYPGSRHSSASWTDLDGNLWLFGGYGLLMSGGSAWLNDLWKYNITSEMWTWISGSNTANVYSVYGTKGVPDIANYPGSRDSTASWTDLDGNLWLYGGYGYAASGSRGRLNDLWRYNITSKTWTWMSGTNSIDVNGVYGTKGVPNIANYPGSRQSSASWTDLDGNLWLFGGYGFPVSGGSAWLNDLWRYNITSEMWTWISGNRSVNVNGVYGTKGEINTANYPGSRDSTASWTDLDGNLWLCGGYGYAASGSRGRLNDLWRYNITFKIWTWISGNNSINMNGVYGTKGELNTANYPGSRDSTVSWTDLDGNLWLFGGYGYTASGGEGRLNDLWRFEFELELKFPSINPPVNPIIVIPSGNDDDDNNNERTQESIPGFNLLIISIFSVLSIIVVIKMLNKKKYMLRR